MDRRSFISATAATPLAAFSVGTGTLHADPETEVLRLFHKHRAIIDAARTHVCVMERKDHDLELEQRFYRYSDKIEAQMMAMTCTSAADFAAKMIVDTCRGVVFSDWETGTIWQEARALTNW